MASLVDDYRVVPQRRVVVTGAPGAGKTVLARELVLRLLDAWKPGEPVPVLLTVARWGGEVAFEDWLVHQIAGVYGVRLRTARDLVGWRMVLPVIDGLDELASETDAYGRAGRALDRINEFHEKTGPGPLVVTCRTVVYERLRSEHGGLAHASVLALRDLDAFQIRSYLNHILVARPEAERRAWMEVVDHLKSLPDGALSTPWLVYLATTVYPAGLAPREFLALSADDIEAVLMARLIPTAVRATRRGYTEGRARAWLAILARHFRYDDPERPGGDILLDQFAPIAGMSQVRGAQYVAAILAGFGMALVEVLTFPSSTAWAAWPDRTTFFVSLLLPLMLCALPSLRRNVWQMRFMPGGRSRAAREWLWLETGYTWEKRTPPSPAGVNQQLRRGTDTLGCTGMTLGCTGLFGLFAMSVIQLTLHILTPSDDSVALLTCGGVVLLGCAAMGIFGILMRPRVRWVRRFDDRRLLPARHPVEPLRRDAIVRLVVVVVLYLLTAITPGDLGQDWLVRVSCAATTLAAGGMSPRYLIASAVGRARGRLPLRPARFLAWAHRSGLLRSTGRTYQFRHARFQQWLTTEAVIISTAQHPPRS
jgi:hypothetical protein